MVKNKVAPPFKVVEFDLMYGKGISKVGELIDLGAKAEISLRSLAPGMLTKVKRLAKEEKMPKFTLNKTHKLLLKLKWQLEKKLVLFQRRLKVIL